MALPQRAITFFLNGRKHVLSAFDADTTVLDYLRSDRVGLTGTKLGCGEGGCGACTVTVSRWEPTKQSPVHEAINACLAPLGAMDGRSITTVEGLGDCKAPHPVQEHIAKAHGSQCGYCTPGIVMALHSILADSKTHNTPLTKDQIEDSFDGNLCRCTGYRPILDAAKKFGAPEPSAEVPELTFPEELKNYEIVPLTVDGPTRKWHRPTTLTELLELKHSFPTAKISVGSTELTIETKFKNAHYEHTIFPAAVPELSQLNVSEEGLWVGAAVSLNAMRAAMEDQMGAQEASKTRSFAAFVDQLRRWFAGNQIRNAACLGGNLATASPISDLNPLLIAVGAKAVISSKKHGERLVTITSEFFTGYRKVAMAPEEVVVRLLIPFTRPFEFVRAFKQARRRDDDIAIVSSGMRVNFEPVEGGFIVQEAAFGFGGLAPKTVGAASTASVLKGRQWDEETFALVLQHLERDLPLAADAPGGMVPYRRTLSTSFFYKFFLHVQSELGVSLSPKLTSAFPAIPHRPLSRGEQVFAAARPSLSPVGSPVMHLAALKQVTGEALYVDDMPLPPRGLHAYFVYSTVPHAKLVSVDASKALAMPGVVDFISAKDIRGHNQVGPSHPDEELFAEETVLCVGFPIGLILAEDPKTAERATYAVEVTYDRLPPILSIDDAIEHASFLRPDPLCITRGDAPEEVFPTCAHVVEGEMRVGGQEQFYLEPNVTHAHPGEEDEMIVYASTQNPHETQMKVAEVLGVPANRVVAKTKRMGGGFGGKESRSIFISCAAAVAAQKHKRPVRLALDRDDDMLMTGGRHPFLGKYKVGFDADGRIHALDVKLYSNAGWSFDLSQAVLERALFHIDNAYFLPHVRAQGWLCKTNLPSNTAFRGFGGPQAMMICENFMEHIARTLGLPVETVRQRNLYSEGQTTHYHQVLQKTDATIVSCWEQVQRVAEVEKRKEEVKEFNTMHKHRKQGIAVVPTKFGMSFTFKTLNQARALVHVYTDGSVLVSHGGTEMGQGLHTKMVQVAAHALNVPMEKVHISETATDKVANASPTAASVQSDLNGMAVLDACQQIMGKLKPLMAQHPGKTWEEIVKLAWLNQIDLSAHGSFRRPDIGFNFATGQGKPFAYFVTGAVCTQVEVDLLTGDHQVLRTDIVMDLGDSLSPSIDIGQIEGAFVQGQGWSTIEEVVFLKNGALFTRGPGNYKIPGFKDIPLDMRVTLLKDSPNPTTIHSSKGVGEPPFFLGASTFYAIKDAIASARKENGLSEWFPMSSPATSERIRMSAKDELTRQFEDWEVNY